LLREVVVCRDKGIQLNYLSKVYSWYFQKLQSIGAMSAAENADEEMFMNPGKIEEIQKRKAEN
jgi:hypothetical protein